MTAEGAPGLNTRNEFCYANWNHTGFRCRSCFWRWELRISAIGFGCGLRQRSELYRNNLSVSGATGCALWQCS